jgi:small nuclear ribonucleoprotein (snRNP)-like protein
MNYLRQVTAVSLVVFLFHFSLLQAATPPNPLSLKERVSMFGVGAKIKLRLTDGEKLDGSIEAISDEAFSLTSGNGERPRQIAYNEVADLQLAERRVYRAHDQPPDPVQARRVVVALGIGKHIGVKTTGGQEFHGHIQVIEPNYFTMLPDREAAPVQIAYGEVRYVEKNLSLGATVVLVVLIAAAVIVIAATR